MVTSPAGVCKGELAVGFDAEVELNPTLSVDVSSDFSSDLVVTLDGTASVMLEALIQGQGECRWTGTRNFPQVPVKKMGCGPGFCVMVALQAVAKIQVDGLLTGAVSMSVAADVRIKARITVDRAGNIRPTVDASLLGCRKLN